MIYGGSGEGKSTFERCCLFAVAYGLKDYLGFKINLNQFDRNVCLIATEDTEKNLCGLMKKQANYFEPFRTIKKPVFDIITCIEDDIANVLSKRLEEVQYSLVVIDTPQDLILGSINDNNVIRQFLRKIGNLANIHNFALSIIHHRNKYTADKAPSKEDASGSQALNAKPRSIYEFRKSVMDSSNPYFHNLTPVKNSYESYQFLNTSIVIQLDPETLTFTDTGIRMNTDEVHLSMLNVELNEKILNKIRECLKMNHKMSQKEIAEHLRDEFEGMTFNQSKVSRLMKKL